MHKLYFKKHFENVKFYLCIYLIVAYLFKIEIQFFLAIFQTNIAK